MNEFEFHLGIRIDGKFYCSIYQHGIPGPIAFTDDFDTKEEAIETAKESVQKIQAKIIEADTGK